LEQFICCFQFCDVAQGGSHPEADLHLFGYLKHEKKKDILIFFWLPT
jgi:hypothetical protein